MGMFDPEISRLISHCVGASELDLIRACICCLLVLTLHIFIYFVSPFLSLSLVHFPSVFLQYFLHHTGTSAL